MKNQSEVEVSIIEKKNNNLYGDQVAITTAEDLVSKFTNAVAAPISLNALTWTPEEVGETKTALFINYENAEIPDQDTGELNLVATAIFVTPSLDSKGNVQTDKRTGKPKLATIKVSCGEVVRFFLNLNQSKQVVSEKVPLNTMWEITYTGSRKSKMDGKRNIKNFDINPVTIQVAK